MRNAAAGIHEVFSVKAFALGLLLVAMIYAGIFGYAASKAPETLRILEDRLASVTIPVERSNVSKAPEAYNYPPAPVLQAPIAQDPPVDISENLSPSIEQTPPEQNQTSIETPEAAPSPAVHTGPLEAAPLSGLYEDTPIGKMPRKNQNGLSAFEAYKRPYTPSEKPSIAIGVLDFGLSIADSEMAISAMPAEVSMILSPYASDPEEWAKKARADGHEVWLQLPIENKTSISDDMGAYALSTRNGFNPNKNNLDWIMTRAAGYVGVAGFTDQVFLSVHAMLGQIMRTTFERGVGYFELNPEGNEFIETLAMGAHAPFGASTFTIDVADEKSMAAAQKQATDLGYAAIVIKLTHRNIEFFSKWLKSVDLNNISIAPLSAISKTVLPPVQESSDPASAHDPVHATPTKTHHE